jgi:hypothetical protein
MMKDALEVHTMPEISTSPGLRSRRRGRRVAAVTLVALSLTSGLVGCSGSSPAPSAAIANPEVGKVFASDDGLAVSITRRICGISGVGADKPEFTPVGQYCTVGVTVENASGEDVDLTQLKVSGWASDTQYFPDYWAGNAADGGMQVLVDGESVESTLFFDVPKGELLERVELTSPWAGIESFSVTF